MVLFCPTENKVISTSTSFGGKWAWMEKNPLGRYVQTGSHAKSTHHTGLLLQRAPRTTVFVVPTANQQDSPGSSAATASSIKLCEGAKRKRGKLLASSPASRGPGPPITRPPRPLTAQGPCVPGPEPGGPTRVPASRRLPAPPRAETAGQGEGRPRPAGPRGGRTPPPGPHFPAFPI